MHNDPGLPVLIPSERKRARDLARFVREYAASVPRDEENWIG
jgi:hypothetical protein